jgi:hypothetical protein
MQDKKEGRSRDKSQNPNSKVQALHSKSQNKINSKAKIQKPMSKIHTSFPGIN